MPESRESYGPDDAIKGSIVGAFVPSGWTETLTSSTDRGVEYQAWFIGVTKGGGGIYYADLDEQNEESRLLFAKMTDSGQQIVKEVLLSNTNHDDISSFVVNSTWAELSNKGLEIVAWGRGYDESTYPEFAELEQYGDDLSSFSTDRKVLVEQFLGVLSSGIGMYYYGKSDRVYAYTYDLNNDFVEVKKYSKRLDDQSLDDYVAELEESVGWKTLNEVERR